jgi:tetratricopeptide (TPR) repeat protein
MAPESSIYALIQEGRYLEALLQADHAYTANRADVQNLVNLVSILMRMDFLDRAEAVLRNDGRKPDSNTHVYCLYADLYMRKGDLQSYEAHCNSSCAGVALTAPVPRKDPMIPTSGALDDEELKAQLIDFLKMVASDRPEHTAAIKRAVVHLKGGFAEQAYDLAKATAAKLNDPSLREAFEGELSLVQHDFEQARGHYEKIALTAEWAWLAHNRLGDLALIKGDLTAAREQYRRAVLENPEDLNSTMDLIRTHMLSGDEQAARKLFNSAIHRFGPLSIDKLQSMVRLSGGKARAVHRHEICGLSCYEGGGGLMRFEFGSIPGSGSCHLLGNVSFALMDSMRIAVSVAQSRGGLSRSTAPDMDVLVNAPEGLVYKDGPSAGLPLALGIYAELMHLSIPSGCAFTGEIGLDGKILPVGGMQNKLAAAYMGGITKVYIPKSNFRDLMQVPGQVKASLQIRLVGHIDDVAGELWPN